MCYASGKISFGIYVSRFFNNSDLKKSQMYQYNITDIVPAFLMKELSLL